MPSAAVASSRPARRRRPPAGPAPWWGEGRPPHERWPGTTIELPAVWSKARNRWESPDGRFYFDADAADRACEFFPTFLTHHIGDFAGESFELLDYQRLLIIRPVFGWLRAGDGSRRFRFLFLFVPKGNGKSPLGSGLGLFLTLCDNEAGAEVYAVAGDKEQARVVFNTARVMVQQSADLSEQCEPLKDSIYSERSRSFYQVLSADAAGKHGRRPHGIIFDELHNQRNRKLYEALRKSMPKRRQPLLIMLSHAGDDDESLCYEEYEHAKAVLDGTSKDEAYLPVLFEAGEKDDWTSPAVHRRANPGFGITINPANFEIECVAAQDDVRKRNDFLRYMLNRWVGQAVAWIPVEKWEACEGRLEDSELQLLDCAAGLDLAQKWDLACLALTFRKMLERAEPTTIEVVVTKEDEPGGVLKVEKVQLSLNYRTYVVPFFWIPEDTMRQHEREDGVPYSLWAEEGLVTATEGAVIDYDRIYRDITQKILPRFPKLKAGEVGYDPAFATDIATRLRDHAGLRIAEVLQNYKYISEASQVFEALVRGKRITHDGHRLLHWNVGNVAIKQDDAGRIRPVKPKKNSKKRIDGVVATIMGLSRLVVNQEPTERNVYNERAARGEPVLRRL